MSLRWLVMEDGSHRADDVVGWDDDGAKPRTDPKQSVFVRGLLVKYWPCRSGNWCCRNGILWDEQNEAVLAHEVGHYLNDDGSEVGEMDAWRSAAIVFAADLILSAWDEVLRGLKSYNFTDEAITAFRMELKETR